MTVLALTVSLWLVYLALASVSYEPGDAPAQRRSQTRSRQATGAPGQTPRVVYSNFSHAVPKHREQACDSCHKLTTAASKTVRKGDESFPDVTDYPGHGSCIGCHRQQFFTGAQPAICSVCHTKPGPKGSERHPFPGPSVSEFAVYFPHETHQGVIGRRRPYFREGGDASIVRASFQQADQAASKGACSTCHQTYQPQGESDEEFVTKPPENLSDDAFWLKKGTFKSYPASHAACFTCHSEDGGLQPASSACGSCHKIVPASEQLAISESDFDPKLAMTMRITDPRTLQKWRKRQSSRYRHEWVSHADLDCSSCHDVAAINTVSGKGPVVPVLSCGGGGAGCHITATTADGGILNSEVDQKKATPGFACAKCHVGLGKKPVPESHNDAITAPKSKQ